MKAPIVIGCLLILAGCVSFLSIQLEQDSSRFLGFVISTENSHVIAVRDAYKGGLGLGLVSSGILVLVFLWDYSPKRTRV